MMRNFACHLKICDIIPIVNHFQVQRDAKFRHFFNFGLDLMPFLSMVIFAVCLYCIGTNLKPMMFFFP